MAYKIWDNINGLRDATAEETAEINAKEKCILHLKGSTFTRWTEEQKKTSDPMFKKYIDLII